MNVGKSKLHLHSSHAKIYLSSYFNQHCYADFRSNLWVHFSSSCMHAWRLTIKTVHRWIHSHLHNGGFWPADLIEAMPNVDRKIFLFKNPWKKLCCNNVSFNAKIFFHWKGLPSSEVANNNHFLLFCRLSRKSYLTDGGRNFPFFQLSRPSTWQNSSRRVGGWKTTTVVEWEKKRPWWLNNRSSVNCDIETIRKRRKKVLRARAPTIASIKSY